MAIQKVSTYEVTCDVCGAKQTFETNAEPFIHENEDGSWITWLAAYDATHGLTLHFCPVCIDRLARTGSMERKPTRKTLRDFTRQDWHGLAGATSPAYGVEPKISRDLRIEGWPKLDWESNGDEPYTTFEVSVDKYGIQIGGCDVFFSKGHGGFEQGVRLAEHLLNCDPPVTVQELATTYGFECYDPEEHFCKGTSSPKWADAADLDN